LIDKLKDNYLNKNELCQKVINANLTYLDKQALIDLYETVKRIETEKVQGRILEMGCALGGSAIVISLAKSPTRYFGIYDVFDLIPPPSKMDAEDIQNRYKEILLGNSKGIGGEVYYGYQKGLRGKVLANLKKFNITTKNNNIHLIQGLYEDTLHFTRDVTIAFAHIDCDWYESVKVCLERIIPRLSIGGVVVIDDYHTWSGCKNAVDEYFIDKNDCFKFEQKSRLHITKFC